ncbi:hypothetical protein RHMOL_Rhmol09G0095800 [Rhododendron molle]|uniref:Uncharacterized protein n=1 Tax=Rhododendron molle TaxID=49168 RepID=A0ACC0MCW7_RHOML|nr:hypothetical protein RHMOL_Rhmol09G0095800 [Rhododendron molle]
MADISGGSGGNGGNDANSGEQPKDGEIEAERARIDDQPTAGVSSSVSAEIPGSEGSGDGHAAEVGDNCDRRAPVDLGRTLVESSPGGLRERRLDFQSGVEGQVVMGSARLGRAPVAVAVLETMMGQGSRRGIRRAGRRRWWLRRLYQKRDWHTYSGLSSYRPWGRRAMSPL